MLQLMDTKSRIAWPLKVRLLLVGLDFSRIIVEELPFSSLIDDAGTDGPVTEMLTTVALLRIAGQKVLHDLEDLLLHNGAAVELVETLTMIATSEIQITVKVSI